MDHAGHGDMDHSNMGHDHMDHSGMDHSGMDHSNMDHGDHSGHDMAMAVMNTTMKAVMETLQPEKAMDHSGHSGMDHAHMNHHTKTDMGGMDGMDHGGMSMSFHLGYSETILFDWWTIDSIGGLIGSMVGIFILAMLYEGLKYWRSYKASRPDGSKHQKNVVKHLGSEEPREHLFRKSLAAMQYCAKVEKGSMNEQDKPSQYMEQIIMPPTMNMLSLDHGLQTFLHVVQMIVSYFLMLIFMTYNGWLCIAVVLGAALGYFLFGWRKSVVVDITEHCH